MATRKRYSREFKIETVNLVTERGMSRTQVARDMGIDVQTVRKWVKQLASEGQHAFPGHGHPRDDEMVRLRRENDRLRQERDILKKHSASSRGCPNKEQIPVRGRPCEPVPSNAIVSGTWGFPKRVLCLAHAT